MDWLIRRRFQLLLLALLVLLVAHPLLSGVPGARLLYDALVTVVFLAAFLVVFADRKIRLPALVLGLPTLVGNLSGLVLPEPFRFWADLGFHTVAALFLGLTVAAILGSVYKEVSTTADSIYGAVCGYLLLGLAFGHLYCLLEAAAPGSFHMGEELMSHLQEEGHRRLLLTYFSFITFTTVGYGDITPVSEAARGLAVVEAVLGQCYLAVLMAELIGMRVARVLVGQKPAAPGPS
jgi:Ion channel